MKKISVKRAIEILDPTHRERYSDLDDGMEQVNQACQMGMDALKIMHTMDALTRTVIRIAITAGALQSRPEIQICISNAIKKLLKNTSVLTENLTKNGGERRLNVLATDSRERYGRNAEGYPDPTATAAFNNIRREERRQEDERLETISSLIPIIKQTAALAGFDVIGRIALRDKETGKEYR